MELDNFESMVIDLFQLDSTMPDLIYVNRHRFMIRSYRKWAVDELLDWVRNDLYPAKRASILELMRIVEVYESQMLYYSILYKDHSEIFKTAMSVATNVYDTLCCMSTTI